MRMPEQIWDQHHMRKTTSSHTYSPLQMHKILHLWALKSDMAKINHISWALATISETEILGSKKISSVELRLLDEVCLHFLHPVYNPKANPAWIFLFFTTE